MSARHPHLMALQQRHPRQRSDVQATPFEIALARAAALSPEKRAMFLDDASKGFASFKAGQGSMQAWLHLVDALNTSEALAQRHHIADNHIDVIRAGQDALEAVLARQRTSWTLRGTEIAALDEALFIWRVQLDFCSVGEIAAARAYVARRSQQVQRSANVPGMRVIGAELPATAAGGAQ